MISCTLKRRLRKYHPDDIKVSPRYGMYLQSFFHNIKGYGKKCWAVIVEIELDYAEVTKFYSDEEIVKKCIEYLNTPPQSKYGKRRRRKCIYGAFYSQPYRLWVKQPDNNPHIQAILLIDKKRNNKFWGEGPQL